MVEDTPRYPPKPPSCQHTQHISTKPKNIRKSAKPIRSSTDGSPLPPSITTINQWSFGRVVMALASGSYLLVGNSAWVRVPQASTYLLNFCWGRRPCPNRDGEGQTETSSKRSGSFQALYSIKTSTPDRLIFFGNADGIFGNDDMMAAVNLFATIALFERRPWRPQPAIRASIRSKATMPCNVDGRINVLLSFHQVFFFLDRCWLGDDVLAYPEEGPGHGCWMYAGGNMCYSVWVVDVRTIWLSDLMESC
jgi:hypothetical protein